MPPQQGGPLMNGDPTDGLASSGPTPDEVRTATFSESPLAWRGYSEDEVRTFLNRVADSMTAAHHERIGLRREVDRLRNFYRDHGHEVDMVSNGRARGRHGNEASGLLGRIQAYADVQVERAKEYASLVERQSMEAADAAFDHAGVQATLAAEDAARMFPAYDPAEVSRVSLWLRAFHHALLAQLQVTDNTLARTTVSRTTGSEVARLRP
jgi:DivIVA domain-containing protein